MSERDLKQEATELLQKVENEHSLYLIYGTIKAAFLQETEIKQGVIDSFR